MNRTQTFSTTWSDEEQHGFSIEDFWEQELTFYYDTIHENSKIEPCGIEDVFSK